MYKKLAIAIGINTVVMFLLTYSMIAEIRHFHFSLNRLYMALIMAAPMVIVMLLIMGSMYENKKLNALLMAISAGAFVLCFSFIRTQTGIGDTQFLQSMIPHHSGAILTCQQANLSDPEVKTLCEKIIQAQREEIAQMEAILARK